MAYDNTVTYGYADEKKTVVRRVQTDYFNLAAMQERTDELAHELVDLPEEKRAPDVAAFAAKWSQTGLTRAEVLEMFALHNMSSNIEEQRNDLEQQICELQERMKKLRAATDGTKEN